MKSLNGILRKAGLLFVLMSVLPLNVSAAKNTNVIKRISVVNSGSRTEIILYGSRTPVFSAYREDTPPKIVLELPNTVIRGYSGALKVDSWSVSRVVAENVAGSRKSARLIIHQARSGTYKLRSKGTIIRIQIVPDQIAPPSMEKAGKKLAMLKKSAEQMSAKLKAAERRAVALSANIHNERKKLNVTKEEKRRILSELRKAKQEIAALRERKNSILKALSKAKINMEKVKKEERLTRKRMQRIVAQTALLKARQKALLSGIEKVSAKLAEYNTAKELILKEIADLKSSIRIMSRQGKSSASLAVKLRKMRRKLARLRKNIRRSERSRNKLVKNKQREVKKLFSLKQLLKKEQNKLDRTYAKLKAVTSELEQRKNKLTSDLNELLAKRRLVAKAAREEKALRDKYTRARIQAQKLHKKTLALIKIEAERAKKAESKRRNVEFILAREKRILDKIRNAKREEKATLEKLRLLKIKHRKMLEKEKKALARYKKAGNVAKLRQLKAAQKRRIRLLSRLASKANSLERLISSKSRSLRRITRSLKKARHELEQAKNRYAVIQNELVTLSSERDNARKILRKTKASLESVRLRYKQEEAKFNRIKNRSKAKLALLNKITRQLKYRKKRLASVERAKYLKTLEIKSLSNVSRELEVKVAAQKKQVNNLENKRQRLVAELKKLDKQRRIYKKESRNLRLLESRKHRLQAELKALKAKRSQKRYTTYTTAETVNNTKRTTRNKTPKIYATVNSVDFIDSPWSHRVVLRFKGKEIPEFTSSSKGVFTVKLPNARFTDNLRRKIDTSAYHGPIKQFVTWNKISGGSAWALLNIFTNGKRKVRITRRKGKITILLPKSVAEVRRYKRTHSANKPPSQVAGYVESATYAAARSFNTGLRRYKGGRYRRRGRRYTGRYVDLDFKDADLHDVIRLMAEVWGKNVVIPDEVKGTVSIKLTNVRVDRAFDVVLKSKGLSWRYEGGNIIRIITLEQIQKERQEMLARTKTKVTLTKTETRLIPINYANVKEIAKTIEKNVKSNRGRVTFDERTNVLIYMDVPSKLRLAAKLVKSLDLPTPQVQIEARIVEAQSTFLRDIGVQWGGSLLAGAATGNPTGLVFPSSVGIAGGNMDQKTATTGIASAGAANPDFAVNLPAATGQGSGGAVGMTLGSLAGSVNINLRLSAMEEIGHIRSIAAPKITTMDNTEAKISQGVEIPYPQSSAQGNTVIMKQAVLSLAVTPHVTNDNHVKLKIKVTKDEPDETHRGADGSLGISKKSAETELLVKSGDTAVIGGIYKRQSTLVYRKVPWFADIPVFGWLFKNQYKKDERSEILIFITPRVLNRSAIISK